MSIYKLLLEIWRGKTLSRILSNEAIRSLNITLDGTVVDLGGTNNLASYYRFLNKSSKINLITVNINKDLNPTVVADISKKIPLKSNLADFIICLNTVYLVADLNKFFSEIHRILNDKGTILINFPFIFSVHDEPEDYWRFTKTAVKFLFKKNRFKIIKIFPYGGRVSSAISLFDEYLPKILRPILFILAWLGDTEKNSCPIGIVVMAEKLNEK